MSCYKRPRSPLLALPRPPEGPPPADGGLTVDGAPVWFAQVPAPWNDGRRADGYGRRIASGWAVWYGGRWRRVYVCCYSNAGTAYLTRPGGGRGFGPIIGDHGGRGGQVAG